VGYLINYCSTIVNSQYSGQDNSLDNSHQVSGLSAL
jgi:hypothetical protein